MSRLPLIDPDRAEGATKRLLDAVGTKLGRVPNLIRALANSPAALRGYLDLSAAIGTGSLSARNRELIALAVAETNECGYCLAAHSAIGGSLGLPQGDLLDARRGVSSDPRTQATLQFARAVVRQQGHVSDAELDAARQAGLGDEALAEIVVNVVANVLTNWFNHVADTPVDFPAAAPLTQPA